MIFAVGQVSITGWQFSLSGKFGSKPTVTAVACKLTFQNVNWDPSAGQLTATVTVGTNESQIMIGFSGMSPSAPTT